MENLTNLSPCICYSCVFLSNFVFRHYFGKLLINIVLKTKGVMTKIISIINKSVKYFCT